MKPQYPDLHTLYLDSLRQVYTGFEYQNSPRPGRTNAKSSATPHA